MLTSIKRLLNNTARQKMAEHNERVAGTTTRQISSIGIRAKVTRADGRVEGDRLVSYGHKNFFIHVTCAPLAFINGAFWNWYFTNQRITKWRNSFSMQKTS